MTNKGTNNLSSSRSDKDCSAQNNDYEKLFEYSPDGVLIIDSSYLHLYSNVTLSRMLGYSQKELIGMHLSDIFIESESQSIKSALSTLRNQPNYFGEWHLRCKDGSILQSEITVTAMPDGNLIGMARDITLQKEQEYKVQQLSRLYATLSRVNQTIIWLPNQEELLSTVCETLVENASFKLAWVGWVDPKTDQLIPAAASDDKSTTTDALINNLKNNQIAEKVLSQGEPCIINNLINHDTSSNLIKLLTDQSYASLAAIPILFESKVTGVLNVYSNHSNFFQEEELSLLADCVVNITFALENLGRETKAKTAETIEQNYEELVESANSIILRWNAQGVITFLNTFGQSFFGYEANEIVGKHVIGTIVPNTDSAGKNLEHLMEEICVNTKEFEQNVNENIKKDGERVWISWTNKVVLNPQGELVEILSIGNDITERLNAEKKIKDLNANLEKRVLERTADLKKAMVRAESADKLKSAFLATMSHELRTPLNSIIGFTSLVIQQMAGPINQEQSKQLGMVKASAKHLLDLINDVLDISKIEAGQLEINKGWAKISEVIEEVSVLLTPLADDKDLSLICEVHESINEVYIDRRRVKQVLINLGNNAIKFTDQGNVSITVEKVPLSWTKNAPKYLAPSIKIKVSDTGIGIKPEHLDILFEPFRQIDIGLSRAHEGTGLGLAICKKLIVLMGGSISVKSKWSEGSEFIVTLPTSVGETDE